MGTQVRFWLDAYKNEAKSKESGMPVFDTVPWAEIRVVGETDSVSGPVHRMHPDPRERFPEAWAHWQKDNSTEGVIGTPLKMVPWLEAGEVETLRYAGIRTLENLASVADGAVTKIPGGIGLRQRAKDMLAAAKSEAPMQKMSLELAKRDEEIASLKSQIADIMADRRKRPKE